MKKATRTKKDIDIANIEGDRDSLNNKSLSLNLRIQTPNSQSLLFTGSHSQQPNHNHKSLIQKKKKEPSSFNPFTPNSCTPVTSINNLISTSAAEDNRNMPSRSISFTQRHTLGQIAAKFQENARASRGRLKSDNEHNESEREATFELDDEEENEDCSGFIDTAGDIVDDDNDVEADEDGEDQGDQSTGRWTKQEHELFLQGLKKYGKEWKKVASMVRTRTVVQTRTHAQKYFQKLSKSARNFRDFESESNETTSERKKKMRKKDSESVSKKSFSDEGSTTLQSSATQHQIQAKISALEQSSFSVFPLSNVCSFAIDDKESQNVTGSLEMTISTVKKSKSSFPQPSPAACGKRRQAELSVAQMLAGTTANLDLEGVSALSRLRGEPNDIGSIRKARPDLVLSIVNPETERPDLAEVLLEPGTPWESQIRALAARSSSNAPSIGLSLTISVSTPSEQRLFLTRVRKLVRNGDIDGLRDVLFAANTTQEVSTNFADIVGNDSTMVDEFTNDLPSGNLLAYALNQTSSTDLPLVAEAIMLDQTIYNQVTVYELCRLLIDFGSSVSAVDQHGSTCLHIAAQQGLERVGKLIISRGCPINAINKEGNGAVHLAAIAGHGPFLEMLATLGANFHLRNGNALSPIDLAGYASKDPGEREVLRRLMLSAETRLRTMILYHEDFLDHSARKLSDWEGPDRLASIIARLSDRKEFPAYELEISSQFEKADVELLGRIHSPEYLSFVNELSKQVQASQGSSKEFLIPFTPQVQKHILGQAGVELKSIDTSDTSFSSGTLNAARRAAGAVAHAVDLVLLGRNRNVFCAIRPPGHHSGYRGLLNGADSCGFCIFNNVAAGAFHALEEHKCERVAIVDLDIHHGNGTEDIVRRYPQSSRLFFFSVHLYDSDPVTGYHFYPGTGSSNDYVHNIINVPIAPLWRCAKQDDSAINYTGVDHDFDVSKDTKDSLFRPGDNFISSTTAKSVFHTPSKKVYGKEAYRQAITQRLVPSLRAFNPDLILLSMGFDAASGDVGNCRHQFNTVPIKGMDLSPEDFAWATTEIMKIADICCGGRVVSVLEGGYGEYEHRGAKVYSTRTRAKESGAIEIDEHAVETYMNRSVLSDGCAAHVHRLIDPYGPLRVSKNHYVFAYK